MSLIIDLPDAEVGDVGLTDAQLNHRLAASVPRVHRGFQFLESLKLTLLRRLSRRPVKRVPVPPEHPLSVRGAIGPIDEPVRRLDTPVHRRC